MQVISHSPEPGGSSMPLSSFLCQHYQAQFTSLSTQIPLGGNSSSKSTAEASLMQQLLPLPIALPFYRVWLPPLMFPWFIGSTTTTGSLQSAIQEARPKGELSHGAVSQEGATGSQQWLSRQVCCYHLSTTAASTPGTDGESICAASTYASTIEAKSSTSLCAGDGAGCRARGRGGWVHGSAKPQLLSWVGQSLLMYAPCTIP
jgi:hypothetical protein